MVAVQMFLLPEDEVSWCPVKWFLASQTDQQSCRTSTDFLHCAVNSLQKFTLYNVVSSVILWCCTLNSAKDLGSNPVLQHLEEICLRSI